MPGCSCHSGVTVSVPWVKDHKRAWFKFTLLCSCEGKLMLRSYLLVKRNVITFENKVFHLAKAGIKKNKSSHGAHEARDFSVQWNFSCTEETSKRQRVKTLDCCRAMRKPWSSSNWDIKQTEMPHFHHVFHMVVARFNYIILFNPFRLQWFSDILFEHEHHHIKSVLMLSTFA